MMASLTPIDVEVRLSRSLRTYERVKLTIMIVVVLLNAVILGALFAQSHANHALLQNGHRSLIILSCAVDRNVQYDARGVKRSDFETRTAFDACVKAGGPINGH